MLDPNPIVETGNGPVKGITYNTYYGDEVYSFQRIPYMKPPIGKLRFKDPEPIDDWTKVVDGTQTISFAPQDNPMTGKVTGSETEIYINVFTKNLKPPKLQPVVISIHGGGFICGSSTNDLCGPDNFLRDDIVFFSFNYRLSVLGFMSFDDPELKVPGNAGLKDQTLAMKWIKANAERFGGDPENITLLGLSAGGASVNYHLISDMSRDLFHKAILMSGAVLNSWASVPNKNFGLRLAKKFGWDETEGMAKALEILQNVSVEELISQRSTIITEEEKNERIYEAFVPTIEPYVSDQCFLPEPIVNMISKQWSHNIPIVIGGTTDEGNILFIFWENLLQITPGTDYIGDVKCLIPFELGLDRNSNECKALANKIQSFYFGDGNHNFDDKQTMSNYLKLMSDKLFMYGIYATIKSRGKSSASTYFYRFSYLSKTLNFLPLPIQSPIEGVGHGADLNLVYSTSVYNTLDRNSPDVGKIKQISSLWNNFVMTSNPNSAEIEPTIWTPVSPDSLNMKCLNISDEITMIDYPEQERLKLWYAMFKDLLNF